MVAPMLGESPCCDWWGTLREWIMATPETPVRLCKFMTMLGSRFWEEVGLSNMPETGNGQQWF